ncbi:MAG: nucleotidyltransferase domain-containing protein [Chloroflexota bacterium]
MNEPMNKLYAQYLPAIKKQWQAEQAGWEQRRQRAWKVARQIAAMLRTAYGAKQIIVFGSLAATGPFDACSDLDLAVSGIPFDKFFRAYVDAMDIAQDFKLDLLDLADCPTTMRESICAKGISL